MKLKSILPIVTLLFLVVTGPVLAHAQALGLAPAQVVQTFKPGVPFEIDLTTANNGDAPVEMSVEITDFWYNDKNEKIFNAPGTSPTDDTKAK